MLYIKLMENNEIDTKKKLFLNIRNKIKNKFVKLKKLEIDNKTLITINDTTNRTLENLLQYMRKNCINRVCISNNLLENEKFLNRLKNENIKILDGRWLFRHLVFNEIDYICKCKKENIEYQEVTFLANQITDILVDNIREISTKVKVLNIITNNEKQFRKIEKELYEEKGIILNITNNYKKSLAKTDIIFNFDFLEEELNKYSFPKKSCIINLNENIKINSKSFDGININFFEILMPRKYLKDSIYFNDFNNSILYESYIYKITNPQNIKNELKKDNIHINFLYGKNGRIRKNEFLNLSKKMVN